MVSQIRACTLWGKDMHTGLCTVCRSHMGRLCPQRTAVPRTRGICFGSVGVAVLYAQPRHTDPTMVRAAPDIPCVRKPVKVGCGTHNYRSLQRHSYAHSLCRLRTLSVCACSPCSPTVSLSLSLSLSRARALSLSVCLQLSLSVCVCVSVFATLSLCVCVSLSFYSLSLSLSFFRCVRPSHLDHGVALPFAVVWKGPLAPPFAPTLVHDCRVDLLVLGRVGITTVYKKGSQ